MWTWPYGCTSESLDQQTLPRPKADPIMAGLVGVLRNGGALGTGEMSRFTSQSDYIVRQTLKEIAN